MRVCGTQGSVRCKALWQIVHEPTNATPAGRGVQRRRRIHARRREQAQERTRVRATAERAAGRAARRRQVQQQQPVCPPAAAAAAAWLAGLTRWWCAQPAVPRCSVRYCQLCCSAEALSLLLQAASRQRPAAGRQPERHAHAAGKLVCRQCGGGTQLWSAEGVHLRGAARQSFSGVAATANQDVQRLREVVACVTTRTRSGVARG